ncbi:MAG TPA: hypothetical protein VM677_11725 [Actinokineospora sp.]|nr:hypothetical protein [Actinokineospora sp.]
MNVHPVVLRLSEAGFSVVPMLNMAGHDTGVLAWRRDAVDLVVVTAWDNNYALGARVRRDRDWARPFAPTGGLRVGPASFSDVVGRMLRPRHGLVVEPEGGDCAPLVEGGSVSLTEGARCRGTL